MGEKGLPLIDDEDRLFLRAAQLRDAPVAVPERQALVAALARLLIGADGRMLALAKAYLSLEDLLEIKDRRIGTGPIGGKAAGMLLACQILRRDPDLDWDPELERPDSFYVGSGVFQAFLVQNGWWQALMAPKTEAGYREAAQGLRPQMLRGHLPEEVNEPLRRLLAHFGTAPLVLRPSPVDADAFGSAATATPASQFLPNQGTPEERYRDFEEAIRRAFAAGLNEDAPAQGLEPGMPRRCAPLALLVQRVSGSRRDPYFFPDLAGVGLSRNPFVWRKGLDPKAGMLRLVLGLGTRAVQRRENDYTRIAALDAPLINPYNRPEDVQRFSQQQVDVLNLKEGALQTLPAGALLADCPEAKLDLLATRDRTASQYLTARGAQADDLWVLTFNRLFESAAFAKTFSRMLQRLEQAYGHPVEIEFTVDFADQGKARTNLLECRPCPIKGGEGRLTFPARLRKADTLLKQDGHFMGGSLCQKISRIIYVDPRGYSRLSLSERYETARMIGRLNQQIGKRDQLPTLLLGPGRWGASTPALGVPVRFSEISQMTAIGEIAYRDGSLIPELSFGTHFFQDLVEKDLFYAAIYPEQEGVFFNAAWLKRQPNRLADLLPNDARLAKVVHVVDTRERGVQLAADSVTQRLICFLTFTPDVGRKGAPAQGMQAQDPEGEQA